MSARTATTASRTPKPCAGTSKRVVGAPMPDTPEKPRNRRVDRILQVANRYNWSVEHKTLRYTNSPDTECWTLEGPDGYTLTVYPGRNQSASVMADIPGNRDWSPITQRDAMSLIPTHPKTQES